MLRAPGRSISRRMKFQNCHQRRKQMGRGSARIPATLPARLNTTGHSRHHGCTLASQPCHSCRARGSEIAARTSILWISEEPASTFISQVLRAHKVFSMVMQPKYLFKTAEHNSNFSTVKNARASAGSATCRAFLPPSGQRRNYRSSTGKVA